MPAIRALPDTLAAVSLPYCEFAKRTMTDLLAPLDVEEIPANAPSLRRPVLVTKAMTRGPEAIVVGALQVVDAEERPIIASVESLRSDNRRRYTAATGGNVDGGEQDRPRPMRTNSEAGGLHLVLPAERGSDVQR